MTAMAAALLLGASGAGMAVAGPGTEGARAVDAQEVVEGTWTARIRSDGPPRVRLERWRDEDRGWGSSTDLAEEDARALIEAARAAGGTVRHTLEREAGTLRFEGRLDDRRGMGEFTFQESPGFRRAMQELGFQDLDEHDLWVAAVLDVGTERARMLRDEGFDPDFGELVGTAIFDIDRAFVREARARWDDPGLDDLMAMRIHGVTPRWMDDMAELGLDVHELDDALAFRIHGVTPDFVREARDMGLGDLDADDLVAMRIHGIDAAFVREARDMGFGRVDFDDVVAMKIHGASAAFVAELAEVGVALESLDDVLAFRIHGIDADFVREMEEAGLDDLDPDELLRVRIHGLDRILRRRGPGSGS